MSSTFFKLEPQQLQKSRKNSRDVFNFVLSMCGIVYFWWAPWSHMWSTSEVNLAWEPCVREARVKLSLWRLHCAAPLSMWRAPWFHRKLSNSLRNASIFIGNYAIPWNKLSMFIESCWIRKGSHRFLSKTISFALTHLAFFHWRQSNSLPET